MKRTRAVVAAIAATATLASASMAVQAQELGYGGELTVDIPELNAEFQAQRPIQESGLHLAYVATDDPQINVHDGDAGNIEALPLLFRYRIMLETSGWTVTVGGGGNPFGDSGGAQLRADHPDGRHLRMNAGHPGVQHLDHAPSVATFVDACIWPQAPQDDQCHPQRWIHEDDTAAADERMGPSTGLVAGIPVPAIAEFRGESVIPEGGRHFHYLTPTAHFGAFTAYMRALDGAGWTINDSMTHGDASSGGGTASASDGTRYLRFSVGGGGLLSHIDACVWPQQPTEEWCPRSDHQ
mgnify:FL=1